MRLLIFGFVIHVIARSVYVDWFYILGCFSPWISHNIWLFNWEILWIDWYFPCFINILIQKLMVGPQLRGIWRLCLTKRKTNNSLILVKRSLMCLIVIRIVLRAVVLVLNWPIVFRIIHSMKSELDILKVLVRDGVSFLS